MAVKNRNNRLTECGGMQPILVMNRADGFTMVELLVYLALSTGLLAIMVMAFTGQSRSYNTQDEIAEIQQNIRAVMNIMGSELRMAGYDPTFAKNAGIVTAATNTITFSYLWDSDNNDKINRDDSLKTVTYDLYDADIDGDMDIGRQVGSVKKPLGENIEQLRFEYLENGTWTGSPTNPQKITMVKIMILGKSQRALRRSSDTSSFVPPTVATVDWTPAAPDGYNRRMMSIQVQCRNQ